MFKYFSLHSFFQKDGSGQADNLYNIIIIDKRSKEPLREQMSKHIYDLQRPLPANKLWTKLLPNLTYNHNLILLNCLFYSILILRSSEKGRENAYANLPFGHGTRSCIGKRQEDFKLKISISMHVDIIRNN